MSQSKNFVASSENFHSPISEKYSVIQYVNVPSLLETVFSLLLVLAFKEFQIVKVKNISSWGIKYKSIFQIPCIDKN